MDETKGNRTRRYLTPKEFMLENNLSRTTVYEAISKNSIPFIRISRRKILIPEDALDQLLNR